MSLYIGLMSGTSVDSVDAVLCRIETDNNSGQAESCVLLAEHSHPIPETLQTAIHKISTQQYDGDPIEFLGSLEYQLGHLFADAVNQLVSQSSFTASEVSAIGSHGQTIRHHPNKSHSFTLQVGDANIISTKTGITTVADFRRKDIALGGQGAPLVPCFHRMMFASQKETRVILNLGGIANITVLKPNNDILGYDTGPANTLMDQWISTHQSVQYDDNGQWARSGEIIPELLERMLQHDFFAKPFPKSTGREAFNLEWLKQQLAITQIEYKPQDIQRTLLELTAQSVTNEVKRHSSESSQLICCGGGSFNTFLLERLSALLPDLSVSTSEDFGVNPDAIEAMAFAWLAYRRLHGLSGTSTAVTGASRESILGAIYAA